MNLNDISHWLHAGKLAVEGIHKVKEFIDSFDETADRSKFDRGIISNEPIKVEDGNCQKCNFQYFLKMSPCCNKFLCPRCNQCDKGSYCRFCHSASSK